MSNNNKSNKSKKTKSKKTAKSRLPKGNNSRAQAPSALTKHVHMACSISNPFCAGAKAAVRPDGMSFNTIPFQVKGSVGLTNDATGNCCVVIVPGGGRFGYVGSAIAAGNITLGAAWVALPGSAFINTNAAEVRIVSFGVIVRSTASATTCSGLLHMFSITNPVVSQVFPQLQQNNPEDITTSLAPGSEYSWISKPLGSSAHAFRPYTEFTTTMSDFNFSSLGIEIFGGVASATVGYAEWFVNVEIQLHPAALTTTGLGGVSTTNKPMNSVALATQSAVHSTTPSLIEGGLAKVEKVIYDKATSYLSSFASEGLSALALLM